MSDGVAADPFYQSKPNGGKIPNEEFYRSFGPPTPGAPAPPAPVFQEVREPGKIDPDAFFRREAPTERRATWLRRPYALGGVYTGIGAAGVLLGSVTIIHEIVLVAPIFEELFKFGLALLLVTLLRAEHPLVRLLIALFPGLSFGVMEHYVAYAAEPISTYAFRVIFHSGSTALSMTIFSIVEPLPDARARLFSTIPSTVLHYINNASALIAGLLGLAGVDLSTFQFVLGLVLGVGAHALAWGLLLTQRNLRLFAARQVRSLDPLVPPAPPEPPPKTPPLFLVGDAPPPSPPRASLATRAPHAATVGKVAKPAPPPPRGAAPAATPEAEPEPRRKAARARSEDEGPSTRSSSGRTRPTRR